MRSGLNAPPVSAPVPASVLLAIALLTSAGVATMAGTTAAFAAAPGQPAAGPEGMPVAPENAVIAVPETVDPGQVVNVILNGAPLGSRIELWGPVTQSGGGSQLATSPIVGGVAELVAPTVSASYQIRYVSEKGAVIARQPFDVAAVPVVLTVMTPVEAGGSLEVRWQGPAAPGDSFDIVDPSGVVLDSTPVAGDPAAENLSTLTVPQAARGSLELRYVTGQGDMLRSVPFEVR